MPNKKVSKIVIKGEEYDIKDSNATDTTYTLGESDSSSDPAITLTPSSGSAQSVDVVGRKVITGNNTGEIFNSYTGGMKNVASGKYSHAEGRETTASGDYTHAEGYSTTASGNYAHAEGYNTNASGYAHAEGNQTTASGSYSHAEGVGCVASASGAHAEGNETIASAEGSHAQNCGTKASSANQTALGKYNVEDSNDNYSVIIGNGTYYNARSNALAVDWSGKIYPNNRTTGLNLEEFYCLEITNQSVKTYIDNLPIGIHYFYTEANTGCTDVPVNSTCYYNVYKSSENTTEIVAFCPSINYDWAFYLCSKTSGTWHDWKRFGDPFRRGVLWDSTAVPAQDSLDLNTITTPGRYITSGTTVASRLANKPPYASAGSKMTMYEVVQFSSAGLMQKCYVYKGGTGTDVGTPEIYIRMGTTSTTPATWYSWYKVGLELAT